MPALHLRVRGRAVPVLLPSIRDSRLHVAATLLTVQVLGQTIIDWDLSIAQILVALGTCFVLEIGFVLWDRGVIAWPASALLTGNGVALLLRVPGTEHGDWWDLNGWRVFAGCAALSVMSKYLIRVDHRPLFNPSNVGLVVCFLLLGSNRADPQDFWWGPWGPGLAVTYAVILVGGLVITYRLGLLRIAAAFWFAFAGALAVVAISGHAFTARWHLGLVGGREFWWVVVTSPETLIFLFFMITDPRSVPNGRGARVAYGAAVGLAAAALAAPQHTEWATKVAILAGLTVVCAFRPLLERLDPWFRSLLALRGVRLAGGLAMAGVLGLVGAAGLAWASGPSRAYLPTGVDAADRAVVDEAAVVVPPVAIDSAVPGFDPSVDQVVADRMAHDLVVDLQLEAEAMRRTDEPLVASAATGDRLAAIRDQIGRPGLVVPVYGFDQLTVVLYRDDSDTQAAVQFAVEARGTLRTEAPDAGPDGPTGAAQPVARTFVLTQVDGYWLISDDVPAPE